MRLCTDDDRVVQYWNEIDEDLELDMDVLDDLEGEAAEVNEAQPWLTYGAPLHRLREWGTSNKLFDLLDERPLAQHELPGFASLILGEAACDGLPHPSLDWAGFLKALDKAQASAKPVWDPARKRARPWFSVRKLNKATAGRALFVVSCVRCSSTAHGGTRWFGCVCGQKQCGHRNEARNGCPKRTDD